MLALATRGTEASCPSSRSVSSRSVVLLLLGALSPCALVQTLQASFDRSFAPALGWLHSMVDLLPGMPGVSWVRQNVASSLNGDPWVEAFPRMQSLGGSLGGVEAMGLMTHWLKLHPGQL